MTRQEAYEAAVAATYEWFTALERAYGDQAVCYQFSFDRADYPAEAKSAWAAYEAALVWYN